MTLLSHVLQDCLHFTRQVTGEIKAVLLCKGSLQIDNIHLKIRLLDYLTSGKLSQSINIDTYTGC